MMTEEKLLSVEDMRQTMHGLLSTLSHDLRTPLSAISGWLFILDSDKVGEDAKKKALAKMRVNIENQVQLIDDVLLLSRSMTGHLRVDAKPLSPRAALEAALQIIGPVAAAAAVSLPAATIRGEGKILADAALLQRVFEILLLHAVKTTTAGGVIACVITASDDNVEIAIADDGKGVPPDELVYLLDGFRKGDSTAGGPYPGSQRNLMLARALSEIQGGQLQASSRGAGLGTTFTLRIPCIQSLVPAANAGAE